ncbi:DUF1194 domain-containing protein [Cyanobium gracile]|uniref:DUF1194 domain-containing protein n=1 Tax=Cyanobium gracile UHCC 0281 TaxID=3110309 RepID=A0ABU5STS5_9CYAN|nr:DUF1194 domain-containing protein [Cyanobium gracile]MEA5441938.1 DUF1194 domain-containing protein [Cyanobium gracile UHCC 0281]
MRTTLKPLLRGGAAAAAIAITLFGGAQQAKAVTNVFQELFLSLDVSGSISSSDYRTYIDGYANAFSNAVVQEQIAKTFSGGGLAIAVGQWSTTAFTPSINWTHITDQASLNNFILALRTPPTGLPAVRLPRKDDNGFTCIDCGMKAAIDSILGNDYVSTRPNGTVIDISTDGEPNRTIASPGSNPGNPAILASVATQRLRAEAEGIIINGLAVDASGTTAEDFLLANVVTDATAKASAGFVEVAKGFPEFEDAITRKLIREVGPQPGPTNSVPGPLPVFGAAAAFGFSRKLRRRINTANFHQA